MAKLQFLHTLSLKIKHLFHVVSNVRPMVWIGMYVLLIPIFAFIYWLLPDGQFRIPDQGTTDYGSWLYYSIVTISTLGFGDYTPMKGGSQAITAIEVMCGLIFLGFFLNAVGSMKSEIDVESEMEKQKRLHRQTQKEHLAMRAAPTLRLLHAFVNHCEAVHVASGRPDTETAVTDLMKSTARTVLALDSLQTHVDLSLWPQLLENCFTFVANYQLLTSEAGPEAVRLTTDGTLTADLLAFIKGNEAIARAIEQELTRFALPESAA